jgi:tetratricopeptide (TPR) repeat protein
VYNKLKLDFVDFDQKGLFKMRFLAQVERAIAGWMASIYHNWGQTFAERGRSQDAINACTRAIRLTAGCVDAYVQRGIAYTQTGDHECALADFQKALDLLPKGDPRRAEIYTRQGLTYYYAGDAAAAISSYNMALYLMPTHSITYVYRGTAEAHQGNTTAAVADFNQAIYHDPANFIAYRHRGDARADLGDLRQAIADYRAYLTLSDLRDATWASYIRDRIAELQQQIKAA